jgi:hypothetical protein
VEYAPHNLLTYSEQLDNAAWTKTGCSISANVITAPNGTVTADKMVSDATTGSKRIEQNFTATSGVSYTVSAYFKKGEWKYAFFNAPETGFTTREDCLLDLDSGTLSGGGSSFGSVTNVGNGWYRLSYTRQATASGSTSFRYGFSNTAAISSTGDGTSGIFIWGAQLAVGPYPLDYTPTTSAAVYGPRFDYDPVTLAARGLLIEEQRTNSILYSEQFDNAAWTKSNATISANAAVSPDGTADAEKLIPNTTNTTHSVHQDFSATNATTYTATYYVKADGYSYCRIVGQGLAFSAGPAAYFDLTNGTVGSVSGSPVSQSIAAVGNGWYRVSLTATASASSTAGFRLSAVATANTESFAGNGTSGVSIWGAQLEAGAFATSYIPTVAATVTRSADVASVNTLSPWFNATEGTVFAEYDIAGYSSFNPIVDIGTDQNNIITMSLNSSINSRLVVVDGGVTQVNIPLGVAVANATYRQANAYKLNDFAATRNGGTVVTDTSGTVPAVTQATLGGTIGLSRSLNGHLRRVAYYPRRLLDAELQTLTA